MTNTLHRQGEVEALKRDYVIFATTARGITREGAGPKLQEFMRICLKHNPVNIGESKQGNILQVGTDIQELIANQKDTSGAGAVFTDLDTLSKVVGELIEANLGISINVSGLTDQVGECCHRNGIERHSIEHSLGFWGATDRLPERELLEYHSMCGHGMISFGLIRKIIDDVRLRRLTPREAARIMGRPCECAVFNPKRAEELLEKVLARGSG
jgi:hypothetical protein